MSDRACVWHSQLVRFEGRKPGRRRYHRIAYDSRLLQQRGGGGFRQDRQLRGILQSCGGWLAPRSGRNSRWRCSAGATVASI